MILSGYGYQTSAGDSFDSVAMKIYGDEKYAAELMAANGEQLGKLVFTGEELLKLPVVFIPQEESTGEQYEGAPWKE